MKDAMPATGPATAALAASAAAAAGPAGPGGELSAAEAAEMELMGAANRDMFSWLLFNSENMAAAMDPAHHHAPLLAAHPAADHAAHALAAALDDPFRMLGPSSEAAGALALGLHGGAPTTAVGPSTSSSSSALLPAGPLAVSLPSGAGDDASGKDARRGKKRAAEGEAASAGKGGGRAMSATQAGLLRHLESANNALVQKRQAIANAGGGGSGGGSVNGGGSVKSEKSGSSGSESPSSLQRKQKLERNRESARECRRRKREHILGVEERCRQLERENMELRGQLKAGKEAMRQEEQEKNRVCEELELMIQRGASEKELAEKIDNFKEQYSDYGHGRRSALNYHLHQIERLLLPTQVTKMCIWALRQDDSFWQDEEDETSLPVILAKELGLSEEQKKKIQQQRCVLHPVRRLGLRPGVVACG